ncbi:MAG: tRNA (adenosine(37)-N6)-threonylcarbamoyltransferase complex transferase subunit TsaD [Flavobacteriaceae bacterium]|nr:tRNA (adenosine(37)-N6)-threonylcarbamoyltransferase complex transferase subunit TsaD [Flavobacteriaceae bacterium]
MKKDSVYTLGIETSCDDTAASILLNNKVLSSVISSQDVHKLYGGVVPELASREHQKLITPVVNEAIIRSGIDKKQINSVAFTRGPGLLGSLLVGTSFAKSLSIGLDVPLIEINHMQAHILSIFIDSDQKPPNFPFLALTVSGGHTQFVIVKDYFEMEEIGKTLDDAVGEAFDKSGKIIGLDYPSGPIIDKLSKKGDPNAFEFTKPKVEGLNFSFSGLKTGFMNFIKKESLVNKDFIKNRLNDICASIQSTIIDILIEKIVSAVEITQIKDIVICGGVSANSMLREKTISLGRDNKWKVYFPEIHYSTDNAAMIAVAGYLKYKESITSDLSCSANARYKI